MSGMLTLNGANVEHQNIVEEAGRVSVVDGIGKVIKRIKNKVVETFARIKR